MKQAKVTQISIPEGGLAFPSTEVPSGVSTRHQVLKL